MSSYPLNSNQLLADPERPLMFLQFHRNISLHNHFKDTLLTPQMEKKDHFKVFSSTEWAFGEWLQTAENIIAAYSKSSQPVLPRSPCLFLDFLTCVKWKKCPICLTITNYKLVVVFIFGRGLVNASQTGGPRNGSTSKQHYMRENELYLYYHMLAPYIYCICLNHLLTMRVSWTIRKLKTLSYFLSQQPFDQE